VLFNGGCGHKYDNGPLESNMGPSQLVTGIHVENLPGAAKITYQIPEDPSLAYVLARIQTRKGTIREFKASRYTNTLMIDGFDKAEEYRVELYSVNRSEVLSDVTIVPVTPLTPPYLMAFQTMDINADFGGVKVTFENDTKADLGIFLYGRDSLGRLEVLDSYFTNLKEGFHSFRGYKDTEQRFGVFIRDRWGNHSDTLFKDLTPLFEKELEKSKFKDVNFPGDYIPTYTAYIDKKYMWDNEWSTDYDAPYSNYRHFVTEGASIDGKPLSISFDLGEVYTLSRFRLNHYYTFINYSPRRYEVWGSANPDIDGSWDSWTKLVSYEQMKPSGTPGATATVADREVWLAGDNADIPSTMPPVRYIRIKSLENWAGHSWIAIKEITFWGNNQ